MSSVRSTLVTDFVTGDVVALAAHMRDCAQSRGALFQLRGRLQTAHAIAASRIVTLASIVVVVSIGILTVV